MPMDGLAGFNNI